ncbi:MAG TPA: ATP-binding cassette domain-containing protein [Cyclobacteriaceae bacterium]|nr:ATP-binding cassette domain-containing protein [Cyclobacteriaceae bacterium]
MEIRLEGISKRFTSEWILKNLSYNFKEGRSYAITGPNGSGKSTLLLIISGWILPSEGRSLYAQGKMKVDPDQVYKHLDLSAPYLELIEDFTLREIVDFHFRFKNLVEGFSKNDFIEAVYLEKEKDKYIRHFSSGMKQRLKLGLGLYSAGSVLLLDEPTSNLDEQGKNWYTGAVDQAKKRKLIILASNQPGEYELCDEQIRILDYKGV